MRLLCGKEGRVEGSGGSKNLEIRSWKDCNGSCCFHPKEAMFALKAWPGRLVRG